MCGLIDYCKKKKDSLSLKEEVNGKKSLGVFAMKESLQWGGFSTRKNVQWDNEYFYLPIYLIVVTSIGLFYSIICFGCFVFLLCFVP